MIEDGIISVRPADEVEDLAVKTASSHKWKGKVIYNMKNGIKEEEKKLISKTPKRQQLYWIYKMILNRSKFEYSLRHYFEYYLKCFHCRSRRSLTQIKAGKRHVLYDKASKKYDKSLDIV